MFEAKLLDGGVLKKIVEAIKDVVTDVNIDVSASGKYRNLSEKICFKPSLNIHKEIYENCAQNLFRFTGLKLCQ